jgi:hypothetical protein
VLVIGGRFQPLTVNAAFVALDCKTPFTLCTETLGRRLPQAKRQRGHVELVNLISVLVSGPGFDGVDSHVDGLRQSYRTSQNAAPNVRILQSCLGRNHPVV